jgi:hypothetical protein
MSRRVDIGYPASPWIATVPKMEQKKVWGSKGTMSESFYPFMNLSKELEVDYGLVLAYADAYEKGFKNMTASERRANVWGLMNQDKRWCVVAVIINERERRCRANTNHS